MIRLLPVKPANADNLGDGMNSYIFRNYIYENDQGRLYGIGGGQYRWGV